MIIADTFSWLSWVISQITPRKLCTTATFKTAAKATETQTRISSVMLIHKQVQCSVKTTDKQTQISTAPVSIELIKDDNKKMRGYSGLNDYKLFCIIHMISKCDDKQCEVELHKCDPASEFKVLITENQLLLVLSKLISNHTDQKVGTEFSISIYIDITMLLVFVTCPLGSIIKGSVCMIFVVVLLVSRCVVKQIFSRQFSTKLVVT